MATASAAVQLSGNGEHRFFLAGACHTSAEAAVLAAAEAGAEASPALQAAADGFRRQREAVAA